ncbi:MAG: RNA polymerase sigma factor [Lachnospiraceae bacterium]|nr:RNA polymerase sigma factor [Lachnospiraceae bacterium]
MSDESKDKEILDLLWARREEGLVELAGLYEKRLLAIARSILPEEEAAECVNDALLTVWEKIPPNRPDYLFAYLAVICRNIAYDRLRFEKAKKRRIEVVSLCEEIVECIPIRTVQGEWNGELEQIMAEFLRGLSREKRILFVRRYWYGDSLDMLSKNFGCSISRIKSILFRVRKQCRDYLEKEGVWIWGNQE